MPWALHPIRWRDSASSADRAAQPVPVAWMLKAPSKTRAFQDRLRKARQKGRAEEDSAAALAVVAPVEEALAAVGEAAVAGADLRSAVALSEDLRG